MKRLFTLITLLMAAVTTATLTSCEEDVTTSTLTSCEEYAGLAYYLAGEWRGKIFSMVGDKYDVTMCFYQENNNPYATSGTGYEIDYGWNGNSNRMAFIWAVAVDNRTIRITYADRRRVVIDYDQQPCNNQPGQRFSGYFVDWDTDETLAEFYLTKQRN